MQKLGFARWQCRHLGRDDLARGEGEGLLEAAISHLVGAYRVFLLEIAGDEHLLADPRTLDVRSAGLLRAAYRDYLPPAVAECANLEAQPGWLADLLRWGAALELGEPVADRVVGSGLISSVGGSRDAELGRVWGCLEALEALIERLRGEMLEY
jgi:hypothetical protein